MAKKAGFGAIRRTLQISNYRNYMLGNFSSQVGMWVQRIATRMTSSGPIPLCFLA